MNVLLLVSSLLSVGIFLSCLSILLLSVVVYLLAVFCCLFVCDGVQLEQKRSDEKNERDKLNKVYLELIEQQRTYYKSVRDFQEVSR